MAMEQIDPTADPQLQRARERLKKAEAKRAKARRLVAKRERVIKQKAKKLEEERRYKAGKAMEIYFGGWGNPKFLQWANPLFKGKRERELFGLPPLQETEGAAE